MFLWQERMHFPYLKLNLRAKITQYILVKKFFRIVPNWDWNRKEKDAIIMALNHAPHWSSSHAKKLYLAPFVSVPWGPKCDKLFHMGNYCPMQRYFLLLKTCPIVKPLGSQTQIDFLPYFASIMWQFPNFLDFNLWYLTNINLKLAENEKKSSE